MPHSRSLSGIAFSLSLSLASVAASAQDAMQSDSSFPAVGHVYDVQFSGRQFRLNFDHNGKEMTLTRPDGSGDTVQYTAIEIRPNLYMVYWTEPKSGSRVTHVEDFERGIVYANSARKDGQFTHDKGALTELE